MGREHRLAPPDDEQGQVERFLQARHGVADRGLAAADRGGGLREAAVIDHGSEHGPLLEGCFRAGHRSIHFSD